MRNEKSDYKKPMPIGKKGKKKRGESIQCDSEGEDGGECIWKRENKGVCGGDGGERTYACTRLNTSQPRDICVDDREVAGTLARERERGMETRMNGMRTLQFHCVC